MTKTQSKKVGKKTKDQTSAPIPEYADWRKAETEAIGRCMINVKALNGMGSLTLNFGHGYQQAVRVIDFHQPIYLIDTDEGTIRVEVERMVIQKKSWWERHFSGSRNNEITVAYQLKGTCDLEGKHFELTKWVACHSISNVIEFIESTAHQERDFAVIIYQRIGVELE